MISALMESWCGKYSGFAAQPKTEDQEGAPHHNNNSSTISDAGTSI